MIERRTPLLHAVHLTAEPIIPCGCWAGENEATINCPECKATYLFDEVVAFVIFRCYQCGEAVLRLPKMEGKK